MLSMVAVSVRRERQKYYLQLSHEDYYVRKGEPLGEWVGRGAARLGLSGPVDGFEFLCLLDGVSRDGITPLLRVPQGKDHDPGWDLTFSAPKGISVIWAASPPAVQAQIEASIKAAVADTVDYIETHYKQARRGPQGRRREHADLVASAFFHCTSRELDPNLHIHLLLMNAAVRADGTTGAILSRPLFRDQLHLGHAFRYALAGHLQRDPGIETYWYGKDLMDACGVPEAVKRAMSQRRQQMDRYLEARGLTSSAAAQAAALATRRPKEIRARELLFQDWDQRLRQLGFGPEQAAALVQRPATAPAPEPAVEPARRDHREAPGPEPVHELAPRQDTGASLEPEQAPADQLGGQQEVERQPRRRSRRPQPGKSASPGPSPAELSEEQAAAVLIDLAREEEAFTRQAGFEEMMRRTRRQPWSLDQLGDLFFEAVRAAQLMIEEVRDVIICLRADLLREVCERMLEQAEALQQGRKCGFDWSMGCSMRKPSGCLARRAMSGTMRATR
jgi:conjugative relaxase-like TrwC/TraI family protein